MEYLGGINESDNELAADTQKADTPARRQMTSFKLYRLSPQTKKVDKPKVAISKPKNGFGFNKVNDAEKILFLDNLSTMLKAGLSLSPALSTLRQEIRNKYFVKVISYLESYVENGQLLSKGMDQYPKVFPQMIVATIEVGENSGKLADAAGHLAVILKAQKKLRSKVFGALMYPSVVLFALVGVGLFLALAVFPQLIGLFNDGHVKLPFVLVAVSGINFILHNYGWYTLAGLVAFVVIIKLIFKLQKAKFYLSVFWLKVPFIGRLARELSLTRFAGNLHALLAAGLSIVQSLEIVAKTLSNLKYRKEVLIMSGELQKGISLEKSMRDRPDLFPSLAVQLCQVGESTGELENILTKLADFYEERVNNVLNNLSTILEPVLLIIVGVAVAFIALSVISPMYELTQSFGH